MIIVKIHLGISLDCVGSVVSLQFQIFPCSSLDLFSRSRGPLQCTVNVNYRVLIRCTCHFPAVPSSLFILALSVCKPLQCLISALTQEGEGGHLFRLTCSVILLGGRDTANRYHWRVYVGSAPSVWTTLGLPQLMVCVLFWPTLLRLQVSLQGYCPKWALNFVHISGLSFSGSWVLHKGTDLVGNVFCALPRSEQLR